MLKHTIYHRYANKMAVLEAVVERDRTRFIAALATSGEACDAPLDQLRAMARTYFGFSADPAYSALYAAIMLEAASSPICAGI
jgi:AcrR family transcriptional regulator